MSVDSEKAAPAASGGEGAFRPELRTETTSYGQILRSSALVGGSSMVNIGIGIVRTKAMAVFLGPAGLGLMGLYGSVADLAISAAGLGINSSGVRQIAESVGSGDRGRIARTVVVLRRISLLLGILGAALLAAFASEVSIVTFGSDQNAEGVALLSFVVLFRLITAGQGALLQGMRRIRDLAVSGVLGTLVGAVVSVAFVYFWGERGIVPSLVVGAAMGVILSWWYSRKVKIETPVMARAEVVREAGSLLRLGLAFMASGFLMMGAAYAVRTMVLRMDGLEAAGLYQAAWTLGGLYVGIILQAMGADFYPRLTAVATEDRQCNRLVNEQAQVSLLLAGPGVIATITFAPLIISLFYSSKFEEAVDVVRWMCVGMALRVISWPMGFIILAKNAQRVFFWSEVAWTVVNVTLSWALIGAYGLNGAGIAFLGSYVFHGLLIYPIVRRLSGFRWSAANWRMGQAFIALIGVTFASFQILPYGWAISIGTLVMLSSGAYALRALTILPSTDCVPRPLRAAVRLFGSK